MADLPNDVPALIDALGGNAAVARIIGKGPSTVSEMRRSNSISVRYWPALIEAARELGVRGINSERMMRICVGADERVCTAARR
jgi:hypothetical protein